MDYSGDLTWVIQHATTERTFAGLLSGTGCALDQAGLNHIL